MARGARGAAALALLLAVLQCALLPRCAGHGMMVHPRSRNWIAYLDYNYPWAHGQSMGGARGGGGSGAARGARGAGRGARDAGRGGAAVCAPSRRARRRRSPRPTPPLPGARRPRGRVGRRPPAVARRQARAVRRRLERHQVWEPRRRSGHVPARADHQRRRARGHQPPGAFKMAVCPLKPGKDGDACVPLLLKAPGHDRTVSWFLPGVKKWEGGNYGGEPPRYGERRRPGGCASRGRLRQRPARGGGGTAPLPLRAPGLALPASLTQTARPPAPLPPPPSLQATARLRSTGCRRSP
jgi:hypothetical protein